MTSAQFFRGLVKAYRALMLLTLVAVLATIAVAIAGYRPDWIGHAFVWTISILFVEALVGYLTRQALKIVGWMMTHDRETVRKRIADFLEGEADHEVRLRWEAREREKEAKNNAQ